MKPDEDPVPTPQEDLARLLQEEIDPLEPPAPTGRSIWRHVVARTVGSLRTLIRRGRGGSDPDAPGPGRGHD